MSVTPKQFAALTDRHKIVVKSINAPKHIKPVELELWIDDAGNLRDSLGLAVRWSDGTPALPADILEVIEPEFKYGDVIGYTEDAGERAVYLPDGKDGDVWLTSDGWKTHTWALTRLKAGWILNPDQQKTYP